MARERARHAAELEAVEERSRHQIQLIKQSSRYQLGDAIISAARSPRRLPTETKRLWTIFKQRSRAASAFPAKTPVQPSLNRSGLRVGAILDEFSWSCFAPEADLVELDPRRVSEQMHEELDLVLVESAWRGNRGKWSYLINGSGSLDPLKELLGACRSAEVPAVFWNKEDPVGFDAFLEAAQLFPTVLTTDAGSIDSYLAQTEAHSVQALPFAAQPFHHNPIGRPTTPLRRVCFAGAWRGDKYPERAGQVERLLGPGLELGVLDIFDRYANDPQRDHLGFPEPYKGAVLGSLSYEDTIDAYRRYAAFLNVNSVTESKTMFSRRVFEILACGTPVISTPSDGIDELLGDVVISASTAAESRDAISGLISDADERARRGHLGYRLVHSRHTYESRLAQVAEAAGLEPAAVSTRSVAFTCVSKRPHLLPRVIETFERQTYAVKELVLVVNSDDVDAQWVSNLVADVPMAKVLFRPASVSLGECLNDAVAETSCDYVAKIDDDDDYGAEYLADMMLTFGYSGARVAGKRSYFGYLHDQDRSLLRFPGCEFSYVDEVAGGTLVFDRSLGVQVPFQRLERGTDTAFLRDLAELGHSVFSSDRFNFVQHRRPSVEDHTWRIAADQYEASAESVGAGYVQDRFFL